MTKKTRQIVFDKYVGKCAYCGCELTLKTMQVDHIQSKRHHEYFDIKEDVDRIDNLTPACRQCNFYKSDGTLEQFRTNLMTIEERLNKVFIFRLALKFGIVELKKFSGKFYYEEDSDKKMSKEKAIEVIKIFNSWRRGAEIPMPNPKDIGIAIETIIEYYEKR